MAVEQDDEFAYKNDEWEIDHGRRELIRHHKTTRTRLFGISSSKPPVSTDLLKDEPVTMIEEKGKKAKKIEDNWRQEAEKGVERSLDEGWKGRTIFRFRDGIDLPELPNVQSTSRPRSRISDPDSLANPSNSSACEKGVKDTKVSKGSTHSAPAEKAVPKAESLPRNRHRVKSVPFVPGSKSKAHEREQKGIQELDEMFKGLEDYSPEELPEKILPSNPEAVSEDPNKKKVDVKPGDESLEPRRVSVPLPDREMQAMTPAYRKMLRRLNDKVELYKFHVKHYHMSPSQFRRRTSMLGLPDEIYEKYQEVYNKCRVCSTTVAPPPRARISGIRASQFGDVIFVDHCEIELKKNKYVVLLVLDGATNLLWATAQSTLEKKNH